MSSIASYLEWMMRIGFLLRIFLDVVLGTPQILGRIMAHIFKVRFGHRVSLKQRAKRSTTFALIIGLALLTSTASSFTVDSLQSHSILSESTKLKRQPESLDSSGIDFEHKMKTEISNSGRIHSPIVAGSHEKIDPNLKH